MVCRGVKPVNMPVEASSPRRALELGVRLLLPAWSSLSGGRNGIPTSLKHLALSSLLRSTERQRRQTSRL